MGNMKIKYCGIEATASKDDGYYPSLQIPGKAVPELKDKKIGATCKIEITGKLRSMRDDKSGLSFELEVMDAKYAEKSEDGY